MPLDVRLWPLALLEAACIVMAVVSWRRGAAWARRGGLITPRDYPLRHHGATVVWLVLAMLAPLVTEAIRDPAFFVPLAHLLGRP